MANESSFCVFSDKSGGEIARNVARIDRRQKSWRCCAVVGAGAVKRQNIAELVGYKDSGGEMVRKVEFETVQGSAPTISVRCFESYSI